MMKSIRKYLILIFGGLGLDVILELGGHVGGQVVGIVVGLRDPAEDAVQLEEDARTSALVAKVLLLCTLSAQQFDVEAAHFALSRRLVEAAAREVFAAARHSVVR